ncbi:thioredoxin fold domain-containing protein [Alisedimentitalea sp. MJ-SS2]|uniref:thioredoxin family protein n=1 Tax=Aliisedimentitalea sp. MJ-SS2 TaxID=3049795 RepID=UPI002909A442|nr:thioredoxin fold domain-containing protein [Alisedimentitalea sp. MJ-SS2]MDU8928591.1 thioredoxin fold domain-containing protein [Alisedimentitalea sp. MJ-SS2]
MIHRFLSVIFVLCAAVVAHADDIPFDQRPNWQKQETWMDTSQGDVGIDLELAAQEGKSLMLLWEQPGCVYCTRLHEKNFKNPVIRDLLNKNFRVVPLDMAGKRKVRARDGTVMTEAQLARRMKVTGAPTTVVFNSGGVLKDKDLRSVAFRMPGYLKSFHYFTVLAYFLSDQHEDLSLREFTKLRAAEFRQRGVDPERW